MKFINKKQLTPEELKLIKEAFSASEHSVTTPGHKVGCAILCKNGDIFTGATYERTRVIGFA